MKERKFIFEATFSLPSRRPVVKSLMTFLLPSSSLLLKLPIDLFKAALNAAWVGVLSNCTMGLF